MQRIANENAACIRRICKSDGKSVNRGLPVLDLARGRAIAILGADQKERGLWGRECNQTDLSDLTLNIRGVTRITWVAILGADQNGASGDENVLARVIACQICNMLEF